MKNGLVMMVNLLKNTTVKSILPTSLKMVWNATLSRKMSKYRRTQKKQESKKRTLARVRAARNAEETGVIS